MKAESRKKNLSAQLGGIARLGIQPRLHLVEIFSKLSDSRKVKIISRLILPLGNLMVCTQWPRMTDIRLKGSVHFGGERRAEMLSTAAQRRH